MVKVYISEQDGDVHFKTIKSNSFEMDTVVQLFKANFLSYDSITHDWTYPIRLAVLNIVDELKLHDVEVEISQDDIDVIKLSLYPPSNELRKVKYSVNKENISIQNYMNSYYKENMPYMSWISLMKSVILIGQKILKN